MWPALNFFRVAERQGMSIPHDDGKQKRAAAPTCSVFEAEIAADEPAV